MATPRILILRAPGTNCDGETAYAFAQAGGRPERVHINRLLENPRLPREFEILCIPGGFSYGDDIAAGRILANQIRHHLRESLAEFQNAGKLILGICNGFQVLIKAGVLLADDAAGQPTATLTANDSGKFEARWVHLAATGPKCVFLHGVDVLYLPVAHGEGKFATRDQATLAALAADGQLVLRYTNAGSPSGGAVPYPANPNGSLADVAGVCDETGRVFGLMPHPERHIDPTQHPRWTRGEHGGSGLCVFQNAVRYYTG
jgi:phosphoribosylformylglycinamidine synthase